MDVGSAGPTPGAAGLKRIWEVLRERSGLLDVTPHDLRRTFASIARS